MCGTRIPQGVNQWHPLFLNIDHVHPQSLGGKDEPDNLKPAHAFCNSSKNNHSYWGTQREAQKWLDWRLTYWDALSKGKAVTVLDRYAEDPTELREVRGFDKPFEFIKTPYDPSMNGYRLVIRKDREGLKHFIHQPCLGNDPLLNAVESLERRIMDCSIAFA
ncbi:hypothetical protein DMH26_30690 [Streptomyces sp. WAC 05379]|nr:hypothetical protein DMH26_30690 [Streptomyces sp. WAC 05379]